MFSKTAITVLSAAGALLATGCASEGQIVGYGRFPGDTNIYAAVEYPQGVLYVDRRLTEPGWSQKQKPSE